jgi:hypothetical protein
MFLLSRLIFDNGGLQLAECMMIDHDDSSASYSPDYGEKVLPRTEVASS